MNITCCKDCNERHYACHATCQKYIEAVALRAAEQKELKDRYRYVRSVATIKKVRKSVGTGEIYGIRRSR